MPCFENYVFNEFALKIYTYLFIIILVVLELEIITKYINYLKGKKNLNFSQRIFFLKIVLQSSVLKFSACNVPCLFSYAKNKLQITKDCNFFLLCVYIYISEIYCVYYIMNMQILQSKNKFQNGNDKITLSDLQKMCQKLGISTPLHILEKLLVKCDIIDKDGVLSYEEFMHSLNWKDLLPENHNFKSKFNFNFILY